MALIPLNELLEIAEESMEKRNQEYLMLVERELQAKLLEYANRARGWEYDPVYFYVDNEEPVLAHIENLLKDGGYKFEKSYERDNRICYIIEVK